MSNGSIEEEVGGASLPQVWLDIERLMKTLPGQVYLQLKTLTFVVAFFLKMFQLGVSWLNFCTFAIRLPAQTLNPFW